MKEPAMTRRRSAKWLAKAVLEGEWTCDSALEEHLHENYRGPLAIPPYSEVHRALCYANMGWRDRVLELSDGPMTVAEIITEFGLEPFLPLYDRQEEADIRLGDPVTYDGDVYRVVGRREVWPYAAPRTDDFELFLESEDGGTFTFVGESMLDGDEDEDDDEAVKR
jgi:hypothetical protein